MIEGYVIYYGVCNHLLLSFHLNCYCFITYLPNHPCNFYILVVDYSDYDVLANPTSPSPSDLLPPSGGGEGDVFPLTFPPETSPPPAPTTLPPPAAADTVVEPSPSNDDNGGDETYSGLDKDELNGKRLTSTFVPLPPISSTLKSIGKVAF